MSDPLHDRHGLIVTDLLIVLFSSAMLLAYVFAGRVDETDNCAPPAPVALTSTPAAPSAEWITRRKPVPDHVLYPYDPDHPAPPPASEMKEQSWHNRVLFPTVRCPYCGRRVPTKRGAYLLLVIGLIGQIAFSARFLVQWVVSERARESVIPEAFWWLSIIGSIMLLAYGVGIWAWPIILGQGPNTLIYSRNLYFIHKKRREKAENDVDSTPDSVNPTGAADADQAK